MPRSRIIIFQIRICVIEDDDGQFYAYCPELGGIHESGDTIEKAVKNAKDSAFVLLQTIVEDEVPLPMWAKDVDISLKTIINMFLSQLFPKKKPVTKYEDLTLSFA